MLGYAAALIPYFVPRSVPAPFFPPVQLPSSSGSVESPPSTFALSVKFFALINWGL